MHFRGSMQDPELCTSILRLQRRHDSLEEPQIATPSERTHLQIGFSLSCRRLAPHYNPALFKMGCHGFKKMGEKWRRSPTWFRTVEHRLEVAQVQTVLRMLLRTKLSDGQLEREVRTRRVGRPELAHAHDPQGRVLDEGDGRHVDAGRASCHRADVSDDQPQVVVLREPAEEGGAGVEADVLADVVRVVGDVGVRDHDTCHKSSW
jgi:hypothetical protein